VVEKLRRVCSSCRGKMRERMGGRYAIGRDEALGPPDGAHGRAMDRRTPLGFEDPEGSNPIKRCVWYGCPFGVMM
jgi:hypothetical protein